MRGLLAFAFQWATFYHFLLSVDARLDASIDYSSSTASSVDVKKNGNTTSSSAGAITVVIPSVEVVTIQLALVTPDRSTASPVVGKPDNSTYLSSAIKTTVTTHSVKVITLHLALATPKTNSSALSPTTSASSPTLALPSRRIESSFPYNQTQKCNIYGPICQTGSITVGIDLTTTTTTTTLPCSSYLTAQSSYLQAFNFFPDADKPFWPQEWQAGFGHSPQCTSYAEVWKKTGQYTFSECGSQDVVVQASQGVQLPSQIPPGVLRRIPFQWYECCGNCTLDVGRVKIFYWGDESSNSTSRSHIKDVSRKANNFNSTISLSASLNEKRAEGVRDIAIIDGQTFISPSVYISIIGTAAVEDQCGPLGSAVTSPIIALNPRELSTYEDTIITSIGATWYDPNGVIGGLFVGTVKPWNFAATTGPTWGLGVRTKNNGEVYYTIGPPFLPLIVPPPQLLSLDPEWKRYCTGYLSNSPGLVSFALLDPPEVLTPVTALTPVEVPAEETSNPAVPARITPTAQLAKPTTPTTPTTPRIPKTTLVVVPSKPVPQSAKDSEPVSLLDDPSRDEADLPNNSNPRPSKEPAKTDGLQQDRDPQQIEGPQQDHGPPQDEESPQNESSLQDDDSQEDKKFQHGDSSQQEGGGRSDSQLGGSSKPSIAPQPGEGIDTQQKSNIQQGGGAKSNFPQGNGVGSDSASQPDSNSHGNQEKSGLPADNNDPLQNNRGDDPQQDEESLGRFILKGLNPDGQEVSSVPSPVIDEGDSDTTKGATVILSNGVLSLITPAAEDDGGLSNNRDPPLPQPAGSRVLTLAGQTVLVTPSATPLAGADILPGGESILVPGTPIRFGPSGTFFIDGSPIPLHGNSAPPRKSIFTVEGQVFTPDPTGFILAGSNVVPGGVPITVSSIAISLSPSGTLFVGGDAIPLSNPPPLPSLPANSVFAVGGEIFRANPVGFTVAGLTVLPGGAPVTVSGTPVSLDSSGTLFVGSDAIPLLNPPPVPSLPPNSVFAVGGEIFRANPVGFTVAGLKVLPGGAPVTVSGTPVSLDSSGTLFLGSAVIPLGQTSLDPSNFVFTVGGEAFAPKPTGFIIAGFTVDPGGPPTTISGTRVSLNPSGKLIVGDSTIDLKTKSPATALTVGGQAFTANLRGFAINGTSILPGSTPITISGTHISLDRSGQLTIGSSIVDLSPPPSFVNVANVYTFGILTFTIRSSSNIILDGKTLVPDGPAITASGRKINLNAEGSLIIGSAVVTLPVETSSRRSQGGHFTNTSTNTSIPLEPYTGGQGRAVRVPFMREVWSMFLSLLGLGIGVGIIIEGR